MLLGKWLDPRLRSDNWWLLGMYLLSIFFGIRIRQPDSWQAVLVFILVSGFIAWLVNLKRFRAVADTPTSKVASAPVGYVELSGHGKQPPGVGLLSYLTGLPCLWYRYRIDEKDGDKWTYYTSGESHDTFGLEDGTGLVLIDPDGAEITTSHKQEWIDGSYRKTEWTLIQGEKLYVIGEHITLGGAQFDLDEHGDISALLVRWKGDKPGLLRRFDHNKDGEIDMAEWSLVRKAAELEVQNAHRQIQVQESVHIVRKPKDGRPFLIANKSSKELLRRYRIWCWIYLGCSISSLMLLPFFTR
jgi:hypothetical protein